MNRYDAAVELCGVVNHMRTWNLRTLMNRFYILKKNGSYRPIGSPCIEAKVMHRFLADMFGNTLEVTRINYNKNREDDIRGNHAFRKGVGAHTAIRDLIRSIKRNKGNLKAYEFDLKSFFNMVP